MNSFVYQLSNFPAAKFFWWLGLSVLIAAAFSSSLSYAKYVCIPFFILSLVYNYKVSKKTMFGENNRTLCYVFLIVYSLINIHQFTYQSIADLVFLTIPVIVVLASSNYKINPSVFIYVSIFYIVFAFIEGDASFDLSTNILLNSDFSNIEANACFLFFFLFVYFFLNNKKTLSVICIFGVLLFFRRTVVLGFLALSMLLLLKKTIGIRNIMRLTSPMVMVFANLALVGVFYFVSMGFFDEIILDLTGLSIGHFTQGRTTFLKGVMEYVSSDMSDMLVTGIGLGNTRPAVFESTGLDLMLHNDIIKLFIENGIIGFSIFIYLLYRKTNFNERAILICFNLFLTFTNMLIYSDIIAIIFLLCSKFSSFDAKQR
jgi:hypothetical protein